MKAVEFQEMNVKIAEKQDEFQTLPAKKDEMEGSMTFCFKLSEAEIKQVNETGCIWWKQFTGLKAMQPIATSCLKKDLLN